jgi:hypothetical protein
LFTQCQLFGLWRTMVDLAVSGLASWKLPSELQRIKRRDQKHIIANDKLAGLSAQ